MKYNPHLLRQVGVVGFGTNRLLAFLLFESSLAHFEQKEIDKTRAELLNEYDDLLNDPTISDENKREIREKREQVRLSSAEELHKHFNKLTAL